MANNNGIITRKDIISDDALNFGEVYAKQLKVAIDANEVLVKSVKELNSEVQNFKTANNQKDYITAKQAATLATQQAIAAIKEQEAAEISANKIKISSIALSEAERKAKLALADSESKLQKAKDSGVKMTLEEKILLAETTKELKYQARERLGLVGAYEKLNKARLDAQKRLADLISAQKKNTVEVIIAQKEFDKLDARVKAVDAAIKNYSKNIGNYGDAFKGLNGTFRDLMSTFGLATGLALFGQIVKDIFSVIKDFDRQLIAVGKTTNITGEDLKQFGREVVELGDRLNGVTVEGLIKSAEVAGQLGVTGTANILKFSEAIEKLKLTSDIISDEQVAQFAKFIEVSSDSFENADRLASVITQLGNSFATTEKEVLANATEIQKGVAVYNTSAQGVLALGAATSSLGSESEVSASSIQKTFGVINKAIATGKNLENVLKLTNLTQAELSKQFNKDATGVFVKFVKGLSDAKKGGQNLAVVLGQLGLDEVRSFKTIGSLAANYDLLANAMAQAKQEYIDNAALNKEVAAASESLSSILSDIKDKWEAYILNADDANSGTASLAKTLKFIRDNFKEIIDVIVKVGTILFTYIGVLRTVNFIMVTWNAISTAATAAQIRFALSTGIGTKSILAQAAAAREAMVAQEGLNIAVKATPWGLILAFLSAAIVAYMVFNDEMSDAEKNIQRIVEANKELEKTEKFYSDQRDKFNAERFKAIEDDIKLRKAQGENSDKLDKEEIARKKEVIQSSIDVYTNLKNAEIERTKTEINSSRQRIVQLQIEQKVLNESGFRVSKQGRTTEELDQFIQTEKDKLNLKKSSLTQNSKLTTEELARLNKQLQDLDKDAAVKDAELKNELSKKALAALRKRMKERYELEKKAQEDLFKLQQFRLQVAIDINDEILNNDKMFYDDKLDALNDNIQLESEKKRNAAEYELTQLGKYNEKTGKFARELSDLEIKTLLENGEIKKKLTDGQKLIIERFQDDQKRLVQKGAKDRQKIIDFEVDEVKKRIEDQLLAQDTAVQNKLLIENEQFKTEYQLAGDNYALLEKAKKDHEERKLKIESDAAKEALKTQINTIQKLLDAEKSRTDGSAISIDKIKKLENELATYRKVLSVEQTNLDTLTKEKRLEIEREKVEKIKEMSQNLNNALVDLGNSIFETRIKNIDTEISKNNEKYDKLIELAGKDEKQKDLLQKERDKKNDQLEKKKRKEQEKQAKFNKAIAIVQTTINTAQAVMKGFADSGYVGAILAAAIGAIELATIISTPIPKYKDGRKGGKKEIAMLNDGVGSNGQYIQEVIERRSGAVEVPTGKNKIVQLYEGDTVHKNIDEYNRLQRSAMMASINMEGRKMSDFQASQHFEATYGKELLEEMKLTRKAIQKQKPIIYHGPKIDIPHSIWKSKNTNWN
ncbi:hypothetical protein [Flavobacterium sp. CF136]|uniref:hypothetical protein n=1 Tax=Flavobacterium sp. (strain CF136) TaxID=1144313 RepID=UPI0002719F1A|nr:hypothetical protein [Flavobacterium sp. CF136]EJL66312.1 Phage-related minor tail protein [Flavobacterium sp. CF136]